MRKTFAYAVILGILLGGRACADNIECVKFLHFGDQKICMKTQKETSPTVAIEIGGTVYYAATTTESRGGVMFEYKGNNYSVYNRDDTEYELIHWLSGTDELVNGVWRDRVAIDGALNFVNHGCEWNDEHAGYYSADGKSQYFYINDLKFDFGTDWYMEVVANVGNPIGDSCFFVDFTSVGGFQYGTAVAVSKVAESGLDIAERVFTNTKAKYYSAIATTDAGAYTWGQTSLFITGINRYSINQSRAFITLDGNRYYGVPFDTVNWNLWGVGVDGAAFYLFRGYVHQWRDTVYQCGPSTIYDIKIWRKK